MIPVATWTSGEAPARGLRAEATSSPFRSLSCATHQSVERGPSAHGLELRPVLNATACLFRTSASVLEALENGVDGDAKSSIESRLGCLGQGRLGECRQYAPVTEVCSGRHGDQLSVKMPEIRKATREGP